MGKKSKLTSNRKFGFIRRELVKRYGEETTAKIVALAEKHYATAKDSARVHPRANGST